jgi:hypothetical protein
MPDFVAVARAIYETHDLELALRRLEFELVEPLVPKKRSCGNTPDDYLSEIWLRKEAGHYLAVRIDWLGHPSTPDDFLGRNAHMHFESFPESALTAYLSGPAYGVVRYDTISGLPSNDLTATHGRIRVLPVEGYADGI